MMMKFRLMKYRSVPVPTIWGWLLFFVLLTSLSYGVLKATYPFLNEEIPTSTKVLVVEGWIPDEGLRNAIDYYHDKHYEYMIVTGIPIEQWTFASPYSNMADATARSMKEMFFKDTVYRIHIPTTIQRDRTYSTAVALEMKLDSMGLQHAEFDLYSMGSHARRSYMMFEKVFGDRIKGLVADDDPSFVPSDWYRSSRGFRTVFGELTSYVYARFFFHPDKELVSQLILQGKYIDMIQNERYAKDREFDHKDTSPLNDTAIKFFRGLPYFPINHDYMLHASFEVDTSQPSFKMPTSTTRTPEYRQYAHLTFLLRDTIYQLTAYQNLEHLAKNPESKYLFIPFKDLTNAHSTYGGGRYLDLEIPQTDSIVLDMNRCYNPYCAYDSRWSCPIPPYENHLKTRIEAGEKKFH